MDIGNYLANLAERGSQIRFIGVMCKDCAFRRGSDANLEEMTQDAAINCLSWGGSFNCHTKPGIDAKRPCIGFLHAKQNFQEDEMVPVDNSQKGIVNYDTGI